MITVDFKNRTPIYEQLKSNIQKLILSGALAPNEQLPSVRALSVELGINPNTIQRAYSELEKEGIVYITPGRGCFVSEDTASITENKKKEISERLTLLLRDAKALAIPLDLVMEKIQSIYSEKEEDGQ